MTAETTIARAAYARLRRFETVPRIRNYAAAERQHAHLARELDKAERACAHGARGLLHEEDQLARRVADARRERQNRPELSARLAFIRRQLRTF